MSHPSEEKRIAKRFSTLSMIFACELLSVVGSGCGGGDGPRLGACTTPTDIAPTSTTNGSLTNDDCTIERLFPGSGDESFVDQYRVTLPSKGKLTIRLDSGQIDSFLILIDSALEDLPIAVDDDSGGNSNALIEVDLNADTYIILANSAGMSGVTGAYTLTTTFVAAVWFPTSATGAPEARIDHTAVWTGSEMIIWGGDDGNAIAKNSGARFDPASDAWSSTSFTGAPSARSQHTAVWTGTQMIIWGGFSGAFNFVALRGGARYDPQADTWTPVTAVNQPSARVNHTAVWTGTEMIVWGGFSCLACTNAELGTGARYNPGTDTWTPIASANAPAARGLHTAIWTGSKMIVWGGQNDAGNASLTLLNTGGVYDPVTDTWDSTTLIAAPAPTTCHAAVWTGTEMIIFGGQLNANLACGLSSTGTGARYEPATNTWSPMSIAPVSSTLASAPAIWSGNELITWFEIAGARYNPVNNSWRGVASQGAPSIRTRHTLVWTGTQMIVWGGEFGVPVNSGAIYNPQVDTTP